MLRLHRVSEISSGGTDSIAIMIPGADATPEAAVVNAESKRAAAVKAAAAARKAPGSKTAAAEAGRAAVAAVAARQLAEEVAVLADVGAESASSAGVVSEGGVLSDATSAAALAELSDAQLRAFCRARGIPAGGAREELLKRLASD